MLSMTCVSILLGPKKDVRQQNFVAVGDHLRDMGHTLYFSSSLIIARENNTLKRRIREAFEIHCQAPTMIQDNGYELLVICRDICFRCFSPSKITLLNVKLHHLIKIP